MSRVSIRGNDSTYTLLHAHMALPCNCPFSSTVSTSDARSLVIAGLRSSFSHPINSCTATNHRSAHRIGLPGPLRVPVPKGPEDGLELTVQRSALIVSTHKSDCALRSNDAGVSACLFKCSTQRASARAQCFEIFRFARSRNSAMVRFRRLQKRWEVRFQGVLLM